MKRNKKVIIFGGIGLIVLALLVSVVCVIHVINNKETKELKKEFYTLYFNVDSLIKVDYQEEYYECTRGNKKNVCSDIKTEITNYEILVDKYDGLLTDRELSKTNLKEFIVSLFNILREKDRKLPNIMITGNYQVPDDLLADTDYQDIKVTSKYQKVLNQEDILKEYEDEIPYYTITFDTDGGSTIDSVVVKQDELVSEPTKPTKDGYKFVEWQVENKKYDFQTKVKSDLTIKALWKQNTTKSVKPAGTGSNSSSSSSSNLIGNTKINLNDNIVVFQEYDTILCGFGIFATNLKEVFPNWNGSYCPFNDYTCQANELTDDMINANINNIKWDTNKEANAKRVFENGASKTNGIKEFTYKVENHRYSYILQYLKVLDGSFKTDGMVLASDIKNAIKGAKFFYGPCGSPMGYNEVLDEELCSEYHLNCGRW